MVLTTASSMQFTQIRGIIMKKLEIIVRPDKLEALKKVLDDHGCGGMTVVAVMGCGMQKGNVSDVTELKGMKVNINLLPKIQVNAVINDGNLEEILLDIKEKISTGNVGDGKVFIYEVLDAMRIRSGERGKKVV